MAGGDDADYAAREREFRLLEDETLEEVVALFHEVTAHTDELIRTCDLSASHELPPAPWFTPGERRSARRVFAHLLSELAAPHRARRHPPRVDRRSEVDGLTAYDRGVTTTTGAPRNAPLPLLVLGRGRDLASERGVECPGDLPAPSDPGLVERARAAKAALGDRVFVLGHHYQRDEVIEFADVTGDSFKLAKEAAARPDAEYVVFCGVHFMAESADILTADTQTVVLPDLAAGCSMADMAAIDQVEECWDELVEAGVADVDRARHVHELLGRDQGLHRAARRHDLHVLQREDGAHLGPRAGGRGRQGPLPPRPAPRPQHLGARPRRLPRRRASSGTRTARWAA